MHWTRGVCLGLEWLWSGLGLACLALAARLALRPSAAARLAEALRAPRLKALPFWVWGGLFPAAVAAFKLAQFHSFQIMWDSGHYANLAWNVAHGHGYLSSVLAEESFLCVHVTFILPLLGPLLRLWESTAVLAACQGLALGTSLLAVFLLTRRLVADPLAPWLLTLLAAAHPFFHDLAGAVLDSFVFGVPLFLWAAWLWASGRRGLAAGAALLILGTRESAPFLFAGFGLLLMTRRESRGRGAALAAAALLLFFAEAALIDAAQKRAGFCAIDYWRNLYPHLGGSAGAVLERALTRPWDFALALVTPPFKLWTLGRVLGPLAFLPLGAGTALIPSLVVWLPHQLAADTGFHHLTSGNSGILFGPLLWASALGLRRVLEARPGAGAPRLGARALIAAALLTLAGLGFLRGADFVLHPGLMPSNWLADGPRALAHIPRGAKVWCDDFFLPHLALRRYVKTLPRALPEPIFEKNLFLPDRVLLSRHWLRLAEPATGRRILEFLTRRGYERVFEAGDLVVLAHPDSSAGGEVPLERVALPPDGEPR